MTISINSNGVPTWQGKEVYLPPKERAVLLLLLQYAPNAVSKDEIIRQVWMGDRVVSDDSLVRCVSQLRRNLPGVNIESVYGYGYRIARSIIGRLDTSQKSDLISSPSLEQFHHATALGQQHFKKPLRQAITIFRSIVKEHPNFVQARLGLARVITTYIGIGVEDDADNLIREALENISEATNQFPDMYELHYTKAWIYDITWQFGEAEKLHRETLKKIPDNAEALLFHALHLIATGRTAEAIPDLKKVLLQRPYSLHVRTVLSRALGMEQRYEEALAEIVIAESYENFHPHPIIEGVKVMISAAYCPSPKLILLAKELELQPGVPQYARVNLPYVLNCCGKKREAKKIVKNRHSQIPSAINNNIFLAKDLVAIGEYDLAAEKLKAEFDIQYGYLPFALHSPELREIFDHPVVKRIYEKLFSSLRRCTEG